MRTSVIRFILLGSLLVLLAAPCVSFPNASGDDPTPPNISGSWQFIAVNSNGKTQASGSLTTDGANGTFSGSGMTSAGDPFTVQGTFVQEGRKLEGSFDVDASAGDGGHYEFKG